MKIKEFFELYKEPENYENKVWAFVIDKDVQFNGVADLYCFRPDILDKEITDFTIVNQLDYENDSVYGMDGLKIYPKTKVFIYTEDWNKYENRC